MTIWKPGMLAVRIRDISGLIPVGSILKVTGVVGRGIADITGEPCYGLVFEGVPELDDRLSGWASIDFRPAVNDDKSADEEFKQELDDILKGRVPAEMEA